MRMMLLTPGGLRGFRYWWAKQVTGFDPSVHCAKCLKGSYVPALGANMRSGNFVELGKNSPVYLCGVSTPYQWSNNFHLAMRHEAGSVIRERLYTGQEILIEDAAKIQFDDSAVKRKYSGMSLEFTTCRNFQFGAHYFEGVQPNR